MVRTGTQGAMILEEDVETTEPVEAEAFISRVYPRPHLRDTGTPFHFRQSTHGDERAAATRFRASTRGRVSAEVEGVVGIGRVLSGRYRACSNDVEVDTSRPFVLRPGRVRAASEEVDLLVMNLDVGALQELAWSTTGRPRSLTFDQLAPVSTALSQYWDRTCRSVEQLFDDPDLLRNDVMRSAAVDLLLATALTTFGLIPPPSETPDLTGAPSAVRRARQYMDDHAGEPITLRDVADVARVSVRGLDAAFRRHYGASPTRYLRSVRLSCARSDLIAGDPTTTTVTCVARRWGFPRGDRFSELYRRTYGESPEETLAR